MKRGDIWTVSGGKGYAGKPRPAVIVQDDGFDGTDSITICAFTTVPMSKLGARVGRLDAEDIVRLNGAVLVFLGLAASPRTDTTRLSSKGQVVIPKSLRDARGWKPGTAFEIEEMGNGLLLRPVHLLPTTSLDQVVGFLSWKGLPRTLAEMDKAIAREARKSARQ